MSATAEWMTPADERGWSAETRSNRLFATSNYFQHATAFFVSIIQGMPMHCTFCQRAADRGSERPVSLSEILARCAICIARVKKSRYEGQIVKLDGRHDFPKIDNQSPFVPLLEAVHDVQGLDRLVLTSPHPESVSPTTMIDAIARLPKLAAATFICRCQSGPTSSQGDASP